MRSLAGKMMLILGSILVATVIILGVLSVSRVRQAELEQIDNQAQALKAAYDSEIDRAVSAALMGAMTLSSTPDVVSAFASGDKQRLQDASLPIFERVKAEGISQAQFHLPPATSFLRLHQLAKSGDDLSKIRATVVEANQTKQPVYGLEEGVAGWGIRAVVPVTYQGRHIGTVEYGSDFGEQFLKALQEVRPGQYFLNRLPTADQSDPTKLQIAGTEAAPALQPSGALVEQVSSARVALWERSGDQVVILVPIQDYKGQIKGYLLGLEPLALTGQTADQIFLIALVVLTLLILAVTWFTLHRSLAPLKLLAARLTAMATGDLSGEPLTVRSKDETGVMTDAFNRMSQSMRHVIAGVNEACGTVTESAETLKRSTSELAGASNDVAQAMSQVAQGATEQSTASTRGAEMVSQLRTVIGQIASGAGEQAQMAQRTSEVVTRMARVTADVAAKADAVLNSAEGASASATNGRTVVGKSLASMQEIARSSALTAEQVQGLSQLSQEISAITQVITEIADQTNLLALNAAIEAARAGEHGRGFAVVAEEVRKLAERSARSAGEIASLVRSIQDGISRSMVHMQSASSVVAEGTSASADVQVALDQIIAMIDQTRKDAQAITQASREIESAGKEVLQAVESVAAITEENTASTEEMSAHSDEVARAVESIAAVSEENAAAVEEVSAAVEEVTASVSVIAESSNHLAATAERLAERVHMFRL